MKNLSYDEFHCLSNEERDSYTGIIHSCHGTRYDYNIAFLVYGYGGFSPIYAARLLEHVKGTDAESVVLAAILVNEKG